MILLEFAAGDLTSVKGFLGPDVLAGFEAAIRQREEAGEHLITEIHALARPVIEDAEYDKGACACRCATVPIWCRISAAPAPKRMHPPRYAAAICGLLSGMFNQTARIGSWLQPKQNRPIP